MLGMVSFCSVLFCSELERDVGTVADCYTDKPQETLESDSNFKSGTNPTIGRDSPANK